MPGSTKRRRSSIYEPYPITSPPPLSMSELICKTLNEDVTDLLIDKWLEHRHDVYWDWFGDLRNKIPSQCLRGQLLAWNKGDFVPENFFTRTVDTGRIIPLDRTWITHVYHHHTMQDRKLSMMPVIYTILPEIMLLRGMHDHGCDQVYVIVTDLDRSEMDEVTEYFKLASRANGKTLKLSLERRIRREHTRISHLLSAKGRHPCLPQIDITFRAILHEKKPPFIILFSHQTSSYSQIFFAHSAYVPDENIFHNFPAGCPNPECGDDCEMIRFPRDGVTSAVVLSSKKSVESQRMGNKRRMCNWIECDNCFSEDAGGRNSDEEASKIVTVPEMKCGRCKLVSYCSAAHQLLDFEEHKRFCVRTES